MTKILHRFCNNKTSPTLNTVPTLSREVVYLLAGSKSEMMNSFITNASFDLFPREILLFNMDGRSSKYCSGASYGIPLPPISL